MWTLRCAVSVVLALTLQACVQPSRLEQVGAQSGDQLYKMYCSNCHGAEAHGNGPVAALINVPVPDLTKIASRNGGSFPTERIYRVIDGQFEIQAHGVRHMPVWGYEFGAEGEQNVHSRASQRIDTLVDYLRYIQQPK